MFNLHTSNKRNENNLLNQQTIRIVINDGPRLGNQAINFTLMEELRKAGFEWKFHLVYRAYFDAVTGKEIMERSDSIGKKIAHFITEYDPDGELKQNFEDKEIEKICVIDANNLVLNSLSYVPIAMTGADEAISDEKCKLYNCGAFITLRPIY